MTTNGADNDPEQYDGYSVDGENQLDPADTLDGGDLDDELDRGYSPPEHYSAGQRYGNTPWEASHSQPLDERLAAEEPDVGDRPEKVADDGLSHDADIPGTETGTERAGRLVEPDQGSGEDTESDLLASDVGIDGAAASAEEAAVHVIDDDPEADA